MQQRYRNQVQLVMGECAFMGVIREEKEQLSSSSTRASRGTRKDSDDVASVSAAAGGKPDGLVQPAAVPAGITVFSATEPISMRETAPNTTAHGTAWLPTSPRVVANISMQQRYMHELESGQ